MTTVQQPQPVSKDERVIRIMERLASGATYREIQTELRLSFTAIAEVARRMNTLDTDVLPRLMAQRAPEMLDHWANAAISGAKAGKHAAARDWLTHARVLDPVQAEASATGAKVAIIIGMPGQPITHDSPQVTVITGDSRSGDE